MQIIGSTFRYLVALARWRFAKPVWPYDPGRYPIDPDDIEDFEGLIYGKWRAARPRWRSEAAARTAVSVSQPALDAPPR